MDDAASNEDRRSTHRLKVAAEAVLFYGPGLRTRMSCRINNRSVDGAEVSLTSAGEAPDEVVLIDKLSRACNLARVSWRQDDTLGLHLVATLDPTRTDAPELAAVRRCWLQALDG